MGNAGGDVGRGARLAFSGMVHLVRRPALWPIAAVTWLMYVVVFLMVAALLLGNAGGLVDWIWARPEGWLVAIWWLAWAIAVVGAIAVSVVLSSIVASIANSPLADRISEAVEEELLPPREGDAFRVSRFVGDVASGVSHSVLNLVLWMGLMIPVLLMNLLPVLGSALAATAGFVLTATMLALEMVDYPLARRRWSWVRKVQLVRTEAHLCLGFGGVAAAFSSIPLVNVILAPAFVVGGTLLFAELARRGRIDGVSPGDVAERPVRKEPPQLADARPVDYPVAGAPGGETVPAGPRRNESSEVR